MHHNKTTVNPYLFFSGNCREAMTFYKEATNGTLDIMPFEGSPMEVPAEYSDKILHSTLTFGDAVIMASDTMPGQDVLPGNASAISIACNDDDEATRLFNSLSDGGRVTMPFGKTFWDAKFGMFTDKFGIDWMVNCQLGKTE